MADFQEMWERALKRTEIVRARVRALSVTGDTRVPYLFLSESSINLGDTVVRKGEVLVQKPSIYLPPNNPQFKGFEFEDQNGPFDQNSWINFLIVRGVTLPSLRYDNKTSSLDVFEGPLAKAVKYYEKTLQEQEDVQMGLITGPEDCWPFSVLIFTCLQAARNADQDIRRLLEEYHRKKDG